MGRVCRHHRPARLAIDEEDKGNFRQQEKLVRQGGKKYAHVIRMFSLSTTVLWLTGLSCQLILIAVLAVKRRWASVPLFFAYTVFCFASAAGLYAIHGPMYLSQLYFYAYWITEGIGLLLGFAVIYELFRQLLEPYTALRRLASVLLASSVIILVIASCIVAYSQPSTLRGRLVRAILVGEEGTRILEVGLLIFLFVFSTAFGLHWRQQSFGVALGLALFVAVELVSVTSEAHSGIAAFKVAAEMRLIAFDVSLLVWISYFALPERVGKTSELPQRAQLEQWNRAVMELIHQ